MQQYFIITDCTVIRIKEHKRGFTVLVKEPPLNNLSKPQFTWIAIWDLKAKGIASKLEKGARFRFSGDVTNNTRNGKTYQNNTVSLWKALPPKERPQYKPRPERDDWFVAEIPNRDTRAVRFAEGFPNA